MVAHPLPPPPPHHELISNWVIELQGQGRRLCWPQPALKGQEGKSPALPYPGQGGNRFSIRFLTQRAQPIRQVTVYSMPTLLQSTSEGDRESLFPSCGQRKKRRFICSHIKSLSGCCVGHLSLLPGLVGGLGKGWYSI